MRSIVALLATVALFIASTAAYAGNADTIRIGALFGLTGKASLSNTEIMEGVRFSVSLINERGGVLGRQLEVLEFDNQSSALGSKEAAKRAVEAGVVAVVGPAWSSHALGAAPVLQQAGIPMVSSSATNPEVTQVGNYIFRICFIDSFQGAVMAGYAVEELGADTAAILIDTGYKYSIDLARFFKERFVEKGGRVLWEGEYLPDHTDYRELLGRVLEHRPDVIFLPGHDRDSSLIIKQGRKLGVKGLFLGGDAWNFKKMYELVGDVVEGNYHTSHWARDADTPENREFIRLYEERYPGGNALDYFAMPYDAVFLLADAIERAGTTERSAIRDALAASKGFKGATGAITMDENRDPIKPVVVLKAQSGGWQYVKTVDPQ